MRVRGFKRFVKQLAAADFSKKYFLENAVWIATNDDWSTELNLENGFFFPIQKVSQRGSDEISNEE